MASKSLRERKNAQVKQALYDAAMELFQQKGFDEISVEEIAERAGYSRSTFFNHFGTKQGVLRHYGQRLQELVEKLLDRTEQPASPLELIRTMIIAMVREADENSNAVRIICTYSLRDPNYLANPSPARKRLWDIFAELVTEAQKKKQIRRDITAKELALHILYIYNGVVLSVVTGIGDAESLLNSSWKFILKGIQNENPSS